MLKRIQILLLYMNPRKNLEVDNKPAARAFLNVFIEFGDDLKFYVDQRETERLDEIESRFYEESHKHDGKTVFDVVGTDNRETTTTEIIDSICDWEGVTVLEKEQDVKKDRETGEMYDIDSAMFTVQNDPETEWNKPCLVIYGSLNPEIEEICRSTFGSGVELHNIRNHYVIRGENFTRDYSTKLSDNISGSRQLFEDDKQFNSKQASMADYV